MSIFKRGNVYWYNFLFNGERIQKSTKQGNPRIARQIEAAHRTALAKGERGLVNANLFLRLPSTLRTDSRPGRARHIRSGIPEDLEGLVPCADSGHLQLLAADESQARCNHR